MKIILLRLPIKYNLSSASKVTSPGGYLRAKLYCEWLVRYPPLGLLYQAALLKRDNHDVVLLDAELMGYKLNTIANILKKIKPDVLCSTVNIYNPKYELDALKFLKDNFKCTIVVRGHFPRLYPKETILNKHIDFALYGKGFNCLCSLLKAIKDGLLFKEIDGLIYRQKNGQVIQTQPEKLFNLDKLPFPARNLIDNNIYTTALTISDKFTTMIASIGCPYSCTYCVDKTTPYQTRSVDKIIAEIEECVNKFNIEEISFLDSTFTIDREKTLHLCCKIIEKNIKIKWTIRTRPDLVDEELLNYLAKAGCISIHYGIESGCEQILNRLNRKITTEKTRSIIDLTSKKGFIVLGFFMIGNDGDTVETIRDTINFAKNLNLHFAQFNTAIALPSSEISETLKKKINRDLWLESYKGANIPINRWKPQGTVLSSEQLTYWTKKAMQTYYLRSQYLWKMLKFKYTYFILFRQVKILFILIKLKFLRLLSF